MTKDLVDSLRRHLKLLEEFSVRAFQEGVQDYLGEIAGKLRVLVYEKGMNKPLLLSLIDEFALEIPIVLGGPPIKNISGKPGSGDRVSLRQYLDLDAYGIQTPSSGFVMLTKRELIGLWAQTNGAAHEDWDLDEPYIIARDSGLFIGGIPSLAAELKVTTQTVLYVGRCCLDLIDPKLFELRILKGP